MNKNTWMALGLCAATLNTAALWGASSNAEYAPPPRQPIVSTDLGARDVTFLTEAGPQISLLVRMCTLAKDQAVTPEIKAEAITALKEQAALESALKDLAASVHVPVEQEPDASGRQILQKLHKTTGLRFDKGFLEAQAAAEDALETSLRLGGGSDNSAIKAFADNALSTVQEERSRVRKLGM